LKSIAIHQPNYIPWLGFFYKIYQSDIFVFLDDVQFSNQGLHNYHFIKTINGPSRLRIPVVQTLGDKISQVKINNENDWPKKHLDELYKNYCKAEYFEEIYSDLTTLLNESFEYLSDLNISIIEFLCGKLGITFNFIRSSDLKITSLREEKIIDICHTLGGDTYYSGTGARAYQNEENFSKNGIQLKYSEYQIFEYPQQFSGFQSNVTTLDFLMNCGYNWLLVLKNQE
jgi:hypothetical protein